MEIRSVLATAVASVLVFSGALAVAGSVKDEPAPAQAARRTTAEYVQPVQAPVFAEAAETLKKSVPTTISIPDIGVKNAPIAPVGLNPDQTVEVPPLSKPDLVGWYKHRPTPGEAGPAVLLGHVDAYGKPAVFAKAGTLEQGDTISVKRQDGSTATFEVDAIERVDKDAFPTGKVYGPTSTAELRLVTCGGAFDQATGHYEDNIIVYAHLAV
ncbi:class F sortase [Nonomuraea sp. NBC_01738]|uniref:class F sortase n=1 Tax=Nonomuraea sp. NBC_01738 TaxID=2976003 RepID=UPI002E0F16EE|nr:class F sortase [Nonomuraea sp. NBC_01738]